MNSQLPDIAKNEASLINSPLEWVGMSKIDTPLNIKEPGCVHPIHTMMDAQVNLPASTVKGIHMSRIYSMIDDLSDQEIVAPKHLESLLTAMIKSHQDCETDGAKVSLKFNLLTKRPALKTPDVAGWKAYPVQIEATLKQGALSLTAEVKVEYSSTCPCSAALSRQLIAEGFRNSFSDSKGLTKDNVIAWLEENASLATPHSQRSEANVKVDISSTATGFGLMNIINQVEGALATPVQTIVKRADEQAFASLNGQNLMYVEDASRRIQSALSHSYRNPKIHVRHMESLHSHDAVASANGHAFEPTI